MPAAVGLACPLPVAVWVAVLLVTGALCRADPAENATGNLTFERDIRPILKAHCFHCHGEGENLKGGVDLRLRRFMVKKSESGTVMHPGKPEESVLVAVVTSGEMPKGEKKLTAQQIEKLTRWIQLGAPTVRPEPDEIPRFHITEEERQFWSFQPIRRPRVPSIRNSPAVRTPIDAFLLARLEKENLSFAPDADRATQIRRLAMDLTGIPPSPAEVDSYLKDASSRAYEKVVDRLLASERYGERWGRHWLDVAGYADSNGANEADSERPWAWRYRDYVIRSLNKDKPFDRFVTEQLAGDELVSPPFGELQGEQLDQLTATGFLRLAPDPTGDGPADVELARNQVIADTLHIVSSSLLGLTIQCAQCHDHRYDPIPQRDYYRLRAVFEPAFDWKRWKNPGQRLVSLMRPEDRVLADRVEASAREVDAEAQKLHDEFIEKFVQKQLLLVPADMREPVMAARRTPADKRTEAHKKVLRDFPTFQDHILLGEVDVDGAKKVAEVRKKATELRSRKPQDPMVHCLVEEPERNLETALFHRGDHQQPREKVTPGSLAVLEGVVPPDLNISRVNNRTTGRRLAFAKSLVDGSHPLTARVFVNRVWHHYFGIGIVGTPGDFGMLGERPTHPELLDWLSDEFMASGWRVKALHRLIVMSTAYRQGSVNPAADAMDPDNRLLGRMRVRRLNAEGLRDSLLAVSGRLNPVPYGPPVPIAVNTQGQFVIGTQNLDVNGLPSGVGGMGGQENRRSIYIQVRRSMPLGVMEAFDAPSLTPNCEARPVSTVAPQALMLMNDEFVLGVANDLAVRLRRDHPASGVDQIRELWRIVHSRPPSDSELRLGLDYVASQTATFRAAVVNPPPDKQKTATPSDPEVQSLASLCQAVLGSNRFLYID